MPTRSEATSAGMFRRAVVKRALMEAAAKNNGRQLRLMAHAIFRQARKGDVAAAEFIRDSLDGKIKQVVEHEGGTTNQFAFVIAASDDLRGKIRGVPVHQLAPPEVPGEVDSEDAEPSEAS